MLIEIILILLILGIFAFALLILRRQLYIERVKQRLEELAKKDSAARNKLNYYSYHQTFEQLKALLFLSVGMAAALIFATFSLFQLENARIKDHESMWNLQTQIKKDHTQNVQSIKAMEKELKAAKEQMGIEESPNKKSSNSTKKNVSDPKTSTKTADSSDKKSGSASHKK